MKEIKKNEEIVSPERREFLKKAAKKSLGIVAVAAAASAVAYQKPSVKSFSGDQQAFAQATVTGKFSLKGTV